MTPDPHAEYDRRAAALVAAGRFAEAEEAVRVAEALDPGDLDRLLVLAAAQAGLGHQSQARRSLFAVLERDPAHVGARQALTGLSAPAPRIPRQRGNRTPATPALVMVLIGAALMMVGLTAVGVAALGLGLVLLLGGFRGNRSD